MPLSTNVASLCTRLTLCAHQTGETEATGCMCTSPAQLTSLTRRCDLLNVFVSITGLLDSHGEVVIFPFTVALLADAPTNVSSDRLSQIRSN